MFEVCGKLYRLITEMNAKLAAENMSTFRFQVREFAKK